jgi:UDP-glucose 4-epimerase
MGRALRNEPIEIWGTGEVIRDYIYIRDAVRAFRLVLERNPPERVFNVGTGTGTSLNALVQEIQNVTGRELQLIRKPGRAVDVPVNVLDSTRLAEATGWKARTQLPEGLERTWNWMKEAFSS